MMNFYGIVSQVLELLQRDGRTTYRALKRQFDLDDDAMSDLREELLFAYPVVDEDDRGLVWTGDPTAPGPDAQQGADAESRFHELILTVIGLLQRERRITYRRLKHVYRLDDALLEDVRKELLFTQVARDEDGEGLVWIGETPFATQLMANVPIQPTMTAPSAVGWSATVPPSPPVTETLMPSNGPTATPEAVPTEARQDAPAVTPEPARSTPEAERRQLTVMFCDLADSTKLSQQLDPEDLREVVRAYQATAAEVIQQYGGHMAQYLGDGLLIYFGWPVAHEDDAQRAMYAGLGLVEAITTNLNPRLKTEKGVQLTVRLGIHTGPVVVGVMGGGERHENLATGETVNIAARLEGLAAPNTVVISGVTERLVRSAFVLDDLGAQVLKGVAEPLPTFRVIGPVDSDEDEPSAIGTPFLVGRDEEVGLLFRRWEQAKEGLGQVVLISGEAGIGKSSLVATVRHHVVQEGCTRMTVRCSPYHTNSALYPAIEHVQRALQFEPGDPPATRLDKLERGLGGFSRPLEEVVPLLAALLSVPLPEGRYAALTLTPQQQRQQTQDALVGWLLEEAERQPTLVMWEDLQWADPSTLEYLGLVLEQTPTAPILHVLTYRPEFTPPWPSRSHMTPLTLNRLERPQVEALIGHLTADKALPAEVVEHILTKTDGVPLYVEELTRMILESDLLRQDAEGYVLTGPLLSVTIPDTLHDSLMARLDRMNTAKEVAQLGAVLGREFSYELIQELSSQDEATLQAGLSRLVEAELLYQRGRPPRARYIFKHALIQDAAYASLLRSTQQQIHTQVAQLLESRFPETVETQPELVAHHYTEAGAHQQAIDYWQRAGRLAVKRSAYLEAIQHFSKGVEVLLTLPQTPERDRHELTLRISLGASLSMTRVVTAPEVEETYLRARALCQKVGDTVQLSRVLFVLWSVYLARAAHETAQGFGEQLLALAQQVNTPTTFLVAHNALGTTLWWVGAFESAQIHLEQALSFDASQTRTGGTAGDATFARVATRCLSAFALLMTGYPEQARQRTDDALRLADDLSHPYSMSFARHYAALIYAWCGQAQAALEQAEAEFALGTEHSFPAWQALGILNRGLALTELGRYEEGLKQLQEGIAGWRATGATLGLPMYLGWLADVSARTGRTEDAQAALTEALTLVQTTGEHSYEAELHRLKGELLQIADCGSWIAECTPEACFQQALDISRHQQAKSWELRAATSLARLWQSQGKRQDAYDLLTPVYNWFTEGFDTADLKDARALLHELG